MEKGIYNINNYGNVEIDIKTIMDEKKITRNELARAVQTRFEVIDKWYKGKVEKLDTDILARICFVLECDPSDIIKYNHNE